MTTRKLTILRHAKSEWTSPGGTDLARPLTKSGRKHARQLGKILAAKNFSADKIVASPARRTRGTARRVAKRICYPRENIQYINEIYEASLNSLLGIVSLFDPSWHHVMLVGHNPGLTQLVNQLCNQPLTNLPTCGVVCIEFSATDWFSIAPSNSAVLFIDWPEQSEKE